MGSGESLKDYAGVDLLRLVFWEKKKYHCSVNSFQKLQTSQIVQMSIENDFSYNVIIMRQYPGKVYNLNKFGSKLQTQRHLHI